MSRSNARSRRLRHRPSRVVPASIVAIVLLAVGALAAIAAIARLLNGTWPAQMTGPATAVAGLTWGSTAIIAVTAVTVVAGAVLLMAALKPGGFRTARLQHGSTNPAVTDTDFVISTRAIARLATARADQVDGVDQVSAWASARRIRLQVTTTSEQVQEIRTQVGVGVTDTLTATGVQPVPRVSVAVRTKGN